MRGTATDGRIIKSKTGASPLCSGNPYSLANKAKGDVEHSMPIVVLNCLQDERICGDYCIFCPMIFGG